MNRNTKKLKYIREKNAIRLGNAKYHMHVEISDKLVNNIPFLNTFTSKVKKELKKDYNLDFNNFINAKVIVENEKGNRCFIRNTTIFRISLKLN